MGIRRWLSYNSTEEIVREHAPMVNRLLYRIFGPRSDIDDLFQMVFVEVLRSLPSFKGRAKMSTWIRRITWNVAYQEMRVHYRQPISVSWDEQYSRTSENFNETPNAEKQLVCHRLYAALEKIDPKQRLAVVLHDIAGHTLKEIAKAVGKPIPTVATHLRDGREQLAIVFQRGSSKGMNRVLKQEVHSS